MSGLFDAKKRAIFRAVNTILTVLPKIVIMLISHGCRFVIFPDPLGSCHWIRPALEPWLDQSVALTKGGATSPFFFRDMSPAEVELAFDMTDRPFHNYTRIAIIQNPFRRMVQLYDRIAATDPIWRMRRNFGLPNPEFGRWLTQTRPNGHGAAYPHGPRWRRFGAWSAEAWCDERVNHVVRADTAHLDLTRILRQIGVSAAFASRASDQSAAVPTEMLRYDAASLSLIKSRYRSDLQYFAKGLSHLRLVA